MKVYLKTFIAVALIAAASHFAAPYITEIKIPEDAMNIFFGVFGVVYAIIIGFAIFEVLNNYNEIKHYMNAEVNELQDLRDYLMYVDDQEEAKGEVKIHIKKYAETVIQEEWAAMCAYKKLDIDTPKEIYEIMKSINKIEVNNKSDAVALEKLINTLGTITTYRTNRVTASVERLPALLVQLIFILSLFMVGTFAMIPMESGTIKLVLTALNSFGIVFIYYVIKDLDYPFGGVWSIEPEPFSNFIKRFDNN